MEAEALFGVFALPLLGLAVLLGPRSRRLSSAFVFRALVDVFGTAVAALRFDGMADFGVRGWVAPLRESGDFAEEEWT